MRTFHEQCIPQETTLGLLGEIRKKTTDEKQRNKARQDIVLGHKPIITHFSNKYQSAYMPRDDIFQAGQIGLLESIERYDKPYTASFVAYAQWRIRGIILSTIYTEANGRKLSAKEWNVKGAVKLQKAQEAYAAIASPSCSLQEYLQQTTGLSSEHIEEFRVLSAANSGTNDPDKDEIAIANYLDDNDTPFDILAKKEQSEKLRQALKHLSPSQNRVLSLMLTGDLEKVEIARVLAITISGVSKLYSAGITSLQSILPKAEML